MKKIRIKICGFTQESDIEQAIKLGVDAIGLVFYEQSKRYVDIKKAITLRNKIPIFVDLVALFVDPTYDYVKLVQDKVNPDILQFHGNNETPEFCDTFKQKYIKAFRVGGPNLNTAENLHKNCLNYKNASAWLFDSYSDNYGGSGIKFDHSLLKNICCDQNSKSIILSGGINDKNIIESIENIKPWAIDLSSSVELKPGIKSYTKMLEILTLIYKFSLKSII